MILCREFHGHRLRSTRLFWTSFHWWGNWGVNVSALSEVKYTDKPLEFCPWRDLLESIFLDLPVMRDWVPEEAPKQSYKVLSLFWIHLTNDMRSSVWKSFGFSSGLQACYCRLWKSFGFSSGLQVSYFQAFPQIKKHLLRDRWCNKIFHKCMFKNVLFNILDYSVCFCTW